MSVNQIYHYYVEGQNEEKVINVLKSELRCIRSGKVTVFDVVREKMTKTRLARLKHGTIVILVFDTDTANAEILKYNINFIKKHSNIKKVITITQVRNLEDELKRSCDINSVLELTDSTGLDEHKRKLNREKNLANKLRARSFDINKFWSTEPEEPFREIENLGYLVKIQ